MFLFSLCGNSKILPSIDPKPVTSFFILSIWPCLLFHWENGVHQARRVYIFSPITYTNISESSFILLPSMGEGALFPLKVISSTCALGLIFIHCLKDLVRIFNPPVQLNFSPQVINTCCSLIYIWKSISPTYNPLFRYYLLPFCHNKHLKRDF